MTDGPELGIRLHSGVDPRRCAELARQAEACGFDSVWFAENPYERGVLPAAAFCAAETRRLRIGIGVFNPYNRHPTLMAMEIGALDELAGGRAVLGIGSGVPQWIGRIMPHERPLAALRDSVVIARGLLAGEAIDYRGKSFSATGVKLGFTLQRPRIPVYVAAMAERSLRLCGELGDGLIIGNMCPPAYTRRAIEGMRAGAAAAGRETPAAVVKYVPCAVHEDGGRARQAVKPALAAMLGAYWQAYATSPRVLASISEGNGIAPEVFAEALRRLAAGEDPRSALDDGFVAAYAVAGTATECRAQCDRLHGGGATEIVVSFIGAAPERQMALLATRTGR